MSVNSDKLYDVAIIGYGPVGATAANLLGRDGFETIVIEKEAEVFDKPRAITFDQEVMRIFQSAGLALEILPCTSKYRPAIYLGMNGQIIRRIDPSPEPFPLYWLPNYLFDQPYLEAVLRDGVNKYETVDVYLQQQLVALEQREDYVRLQVKDLNKGNVQKIDARYIWACDGAASPTRTMVGVDLEDLGFDEQWIVVDINVKDPSTLPDTNIQYCEPERPSTYVIGPNRHRRWEMMLLPNETPEETLKEENILKLLTRWGEPANFEIRRAAIYRFHALVAQEWRKGRVFLMGDAAHQTPPFMGQGMCQGIRDTANLIWKHGLVERLNNSGTLFDSYTLERKPHVKALTKFTIGLGETICMRDPVAAANRDKRLKADLDSGHMVTIRQNLIPDLLDGLIDLSPAGSPIKPAGGLFYQPLVRTLSGEDKPMDDAVTRGFLIVTTVASLLGSIPVKLEDWWRSIGGEFVTLNDTSAGKREGIIQLKELNGVLTTFFEEWGCCCVVVRPDRYIYGAALDSQKLNSMLQTIKKRLTS